MTNRIPLIIVSVIAVFLLAYCNLSRSVEIITIAADNPPPYSADQVIKISYAIRNTGGRGIGGLASVTSDKMAVACPGLNTTGDLDDLLDRGEEIKCTGDFQVKAADIQAGVVQITASATVGSVVSNPVTANLSTVPNNLLPSPLGLTTSASPSTYSQAGQQVTLTYVISEYWHRQPRADLSTVSDNLIGTAPFNCGPANTTLAPSATVTCTAPAPYTITQNDMTAVSITNIAAASASGVAASAAASTTINRKSHQPGFDDDSRSVHLQSGWSGDQLYLRHQEYSVGKPGTIPIYCERQSDQRRTVQLRSGEYHPCFERHSHLYCPIHGYTK